MNKRFCIAVLALGVASACLAQGNDKSPIKIGALYATSGPGAVNGNPVVRGTQMAVDEFNAKGGIAGRKIELLVRDNKLSPATSVALARELISKDQVAALVGGIGSGEALAISELARQEKTVFLAPVVKSVELTSPTKIHPYVFKTGGMADVEGAQLAQVANDLGVKRICQIQYDYAYGQEVSKGFLDALPKVAPGAQVVLDLKVKLGNTDYSSFVSQIMNAGCDGVVAALWGDGFINLARQGKPFGLFSKIKYISGGEIGNPEITNVLKADYPDNVYTNSYELWYDHSMSPTHVAYQRELAKREGQETTSMWALLGYTGMKFVLTAIEKAGSTQPDDIAKALEGLTIETPVGKRTIDPKTHRADTGQYWGPMKHSDKWGFKVMDAAKYYPASK